MSERIGGRIGLVVLACLLAGGCQGSRPTPSEALAPFMQPGMARPTVGGPNQELAVQRKREKIVASVLRVFEDTGVELAAAGEPPESLWVLGKSLANRQVLVDIVPIVPGRFAVRITVEGADQITRTLLDDMARKLRARIG